MAAGDCSNRDDTDVFAASGPARQVLCVGVMVSLGVLGRRDSVVMGINDGIYCFAVTQREGTFFF